MKLVRFISRPEHIKLMGDLELTNTRDHHAEGNATDSIGFCFAVLDDSIYDLARSLSGIVDMSYCIVAEVKKDREEKFKRGFGMYSNHDAGLLSRRELPEYSTISYSLDDFSSWTMYEPDPSAGAFIYSESWRNPVEVNHGN